MNLATARGRILACVPERAHPHVRRAFRLSRDVLAAARTGRRLIGGERVVWLRPEVADLERFRLLAPGPGQVLLRTRISLVSPGTERAVLLELPNAGTSFPAFPGYSAAGWVEAVGHGVTEFQPGERVAGQAPHASRALVAPANLVRVPDGVSDEDAAFVELAVIALQGVRRARLRPGERVVVLGLGLVGQLALRLACWTGASPLIAAARTATWFEAARAGGADECVALGSRPDVAASLAGDVVLEATGNPSAVITALQAARPEGRVVLLGSSRGVTDGVDLQNLVAARGIELIGAHISSLASQESSAGRWTRRDEADLFLELVARRRFGLNGLITRRASPSEANTVYRSLVDECERNLGIIFDWASPPASSRTLPTRTRPEPRSTPPGDAAVMMGPSSGPSAARPSSAPRLGIGLVGCGEISRVNAAGIQASTRCALIQVMDLDVDAARATSRRFEVPCTTSLDALLENSAVDAVVVAVPHHLHASIVNRAAQAGKHVIVEKPIATTLEDADSMIAACRRAKVALSVLFSFRYQPHVQHARELVQAGALGRVVGTRVSFSIEKPVGYWSRGYSGRATDWRGSRNKSGGGVLIMNVCHAIDCLRYVTSLEVERVYAEFGTENSPVDVEDIISVTLRYVGGGVGSIDASSLARGEDRLEERIWGTHGTLSLSPGPARLYTLRKMTGVRPGTWQSLGKLPSADRVITYFDRFAAAVQEGREPEITGEDGRTNLAVVLAAYAAGDTGRAVDLRGAPGS